jgi:transcriptional accessory protein Tex/SPT6
MDRINKKPGGTQLLDELKTGMELKGGVVRVNDFAAFLDVKVVRKGQQGRVRL